MSILRGLAALMLVCCIFVMLFFAGCNAVTEKVTGWGIARTYLEEARVFAERDIELATIYANRDVDVAAIAADRDVEIAAISADVSKKTDGSFILFYLIRGGMWVAGSLLVLYVALLGLRSLWRVD